MSKYFISSPKKSGINRVVKKSWVNYTDKDMAYEMYHSHYDSFYTTIVYMIENPEGIGTKFKIGDEIYETECSTNSAMLFPTTMELLFHQIHAKI